VVPALQRAGDGGFYQVCTFQAVHRYLAESTINSLFSSVKHHSPLSSPFPSPPIPHKKKENAPKKKGQRKETENLFTNFICPEYRAVRGGTHIKAGCLSFAVISFLFFPFFAFSAAHRNARKQVSFGANRSICLFEKQSSQRSSLFFCTSPLLLVPD